MKKLLLALTILATFTAKSQTQIDFFTTMGDFRVEVREDLMPITAGNFISLVDSGFYDGIIFHRVVSGFVIQGGDPLGTGFGGPGYTINDEYHPSMTHDSAGVLAMAKTSQPNSAGSQFYFTLASQSQLDGLYAVFGSCIQGLQVIQDIGQVAVNGNDRPLTDVVMDSVRIVIPEPPVSVSEAAPVGVKAEVFPNPFRSEARINYEVSTTGPVQVHLYDLTGNRVRTLVNANQSAGIHSLDLSAEGLPVGLYFLNLETPAGKKVMKLTRVN